MILDFGGVEGRPANSAAKHPRLISIESLRGVLLGEVVLAHRFAYESTHFELFS